MLDAGLSAASGAAVSTLTGVWVGSSAVDGTQIDSREAFGRSTPVCGPALHSRSVGVEPAAAGDPDQWAELSRLPSTPMATATDWNPLLRGEFSEPYWAELQRFVAAERTAHPVFPPEGDVFAALHLTAYADVKVVILGQDPYHGPGQAHGLCFSVRPGVRPPPSLRNIFKELQEDVGAEPPANGNLDAWARQGVLLLNTTLTVRSGAAASHQGNGWETFTDQVIRAVSVKPETVVFILWGASARKKKALIDQTRHVVIESAHPSPLSAHNGFFGSQPFSRANAALEATGRQPIDWNLVDI